MYLLHYFYSIVASLPHVLHVQCAEVTTGADAALKMRNAGGKPPLGCGIAGGSRNISMWGGRFLPEHPSAVLEQDMNGLHAVSRKVEDPGGINPRASRVVNLLWKDGHARWASR